MSEWLNLFSSGCAALTFRASGREVIEESTASALGSETSSGHGAAVTFRICAVVGCQVSTHGLQTQPKTHALNCLELTPSKHSVVFHAHHKNAFSQWQLKLGFACD